MWIGEPGWNRMALDESHNPLEFGMALYEVLHYRRVGLTRFRIRLRREHQLVERFRSRERKIGRSIIDVRQSAPSRSVNCRPRPCAVVRCISHIWQTAHR